MLRLVIYCDIIQLLSVVYLFRYRQRLTELLLSLLRRILDDVSRLCDSALCFER